MKRWKICCGSLVLFAGLSPVAHAQLPAPAPAAAGVPPAAVGLPAAPVAAAPAPANLWTFLCLPPEKKAACKAKLCSSPLGQMLNNSLRPASAMTGGLVPGCCPAVNPADLAKPADSPAGAAARIQQDEIEAKARREDVRILGLKDCHYWPEAQLALINALRADRNECVRLEAAFALGNGCCCTKATIKALTICVSGSEEDGNPSENSPRVRGAAEGALAHCLACYTEVVPVPPEIKKTIETPPGGEKPVPSTPTKAPDKLPNIGKAPVQPADYYKHVATMSHQEVVEDGKRVVDRGVTTQVQVAGQPTAAHSVTDIVRNAFNTGSAPVMTMPAPVMVDRNVQPIPVVPVSSPPPPLAPLSKATSVTTPAAMRSPVVQTSAYDQAPASPPAPAATTVTPPMPIITTAPSSPASSTPTPTQSTLDGARRLPSYQTQTFVPKAPITEKPAAVATTPTKTESKPAVPPALTTTESKLALPAVAVKIESKPTVTPAPVKTESKPTLPSAPVKTESKPTVPAAKTATEPKPNLAPAAAQLALQPGGADKASLLSLLHAGSHPEQRIWAAQALGTCDGWMNPDIMEALVKSARTDANTSVRTACVRCLGRMNVCTLPVMTAVQELKSDRDPLVRAEAEQTLRQLGDAGPVQVR